MYNSFSKVSVIIPVYNGSDYISEAIESALCQTYKNIEIIIVNDGSKDEGATERIVKAYGDRVIYFYKENGGVASALNFGINIMTGDYFSWLSHDDVYYPDKIESQIRLIVDQEDRKIIYSDCETIDEKGNVIGKYDISDYQKDNLLYSLLISRFINGCALLIPRSVFLNVGLFDETLKTVQDYDMWFRLLRAGYQFIHLPQVSVKSRTHPGQDSNLFRTDLLFEEQLLFKSIIESSAPELLFENRENLTKSYLKMAFAFVTQSMFVVSKTSIDFAYQHFWENDLPNILINILLLCRYVVIKNLKKIRIIKNIIIKKLSKYKFDPRIGCYNS